MPKIVKKQKLIPKFPDPRTGHTMTVLDNYIIMYGGTNHINETLYERLWYFDIMRDRWYQKFVEIPTQRFCISAEIIAIGSKLFIFGCMEISYADLMNNVFSSYDTERKKWELRHEKISLTKTYDDTSVNICNLFHYKNCLYIFAKTIVNNGFYTIFMYSFQTKKFKLIPQKGDIPRLSNKIHGCVHNDKFYYFGNAEGSMPDQFLKISILDLNTFIWTTVESLSHNSSYPVERINYSMAFNSTHGFLSGGKLESGQLLNDIWSFDLQSLKWKEMKFKLNKKIMSHTSCIYKNSTLYIYGGIDENNVLISDIQKYYFEPPSLLHLCKIATIKDRFTRSKYYRFPNSLCEKVEMF